MTRTTEQVRHAYETPNPIELSVEFGKGYLHVSAVDIQQTEIAIGGRFADDVDVIQDGGRISVSSPRYRDSFFGKDTALDIRITLPLGSALMSKTGSADTVVSGHIGPTRLKSGSGDIRVEHADGTALIETGSGAITVDHATHEVQVKSGSGHVTLGQTADAPAAVSTGSGDVRIGQSLGPALAKTGSGDLTIDQTFADVSLSSGSGDLEIRCAHHGRINLTSASGDCRVGVPAGVPVWTDISTRSGRIESDLASTGEPDPDQPFVAVRIVSASGNVTLSEVRQPVAT